jgi:hypothetical protein
VGSWGEARELVRGKVVSEVDEMWAYVGRPFTGVHVLCAHVPEPLRPLLRGGQGPGAFNGLRNYVPDGGRWVSDGYNMYSLRDHTVVSPGTPTSPSTRH